MLDASHSRLRGAGIKQRPGWPHRTNAPPPQPLPASSLGSTTNCRQLATSAIASAAAAASDVDHPCRDKSPTARRPPAEPALHAG